MSSENRDNFTSFLIWISCWQFFKGKIHLQAANSSWYRTMLHWHFQSTPRSVMLLPLASNSVINWVSTFLFVIILFEICEEIMGWYITTYYSQYWSELSWTCLKITVSVLQQVTQTNLMMTSFWMYHWDKLHTNIHTNTPVHIHIHTDTPTCTHTDIHKPILIISLHFWLCVIVVVSYAYHPHSFPFYYPPSFSFFLHSCCRLSYIFLWSGKAGDVYETV